MKIFDPEFDKLNYSFDYNPVETETLKKRKYDTISMNDLRRIALWKLNRVLDIPEETINKLHKLATTKPLTVESDETKDILRSLTACKGVGFPMASTFLKFIRPDVFPIIDVRAYRALTGESLRSDQYNIEIYIKYVNKISQISKRIGIDLSEVDEQLYCFDKHHNKRINK